MLILPHFREPTGADALARDNNIGRATAYRYIDEGIEVLARKAPDLQNTLHNSGRVILDGKLFESDRCAERKPADDGVDLWYSGHKHRHGGNVQFRSRRSARIRPYLRVLERRRASDAYVFVQFAGLVIRAGLAVRR